MINNKKFLRQCVFCKENKSKDELIRITKDNKTQEIEINTANKYQGRSVYICKDIECIKGAIKKKKIESSLKCTIPENIKEELGNITNL